LSALVAARALVSSWIKPAAPAIRTSGSVQLETKGIALDFILTSGAVYT
jgi:hypothetical protein